MRAMESAGVVRTLAEPNLTAISGESATFIVGGEFPYSRRRDFLRSGHACLARTQISYKKFGISLNFTPVVLTRGADQPAGDDRSLRTVRAKMHHPEPGGNP